MSTGKFTAKTCESIRYYVYCLIDPRDKKIFYVGKGKANRVFQHAKGAMEKDAETEKLNLIREIRAEGSDVEYRIIRHGLDSDTAYEIESVLIDMFTSPLLEEALSRKSKMTTLCSGYYQSIRGIMTADELELFYAAEPISITPTDYPVFVSLNKTFGRMDIYEATRRAWRIAAYRIPKITHVIGVYQGIVRSVYIPREWTCTKENGKKFWEFVGTNDTASSYMNKDISNVASFGRGSSICYPIQKTSLIQ